MTDDLKSELAAYGDQHEDRQKSIAAADVLERIDPVHPLPRYESFATARPMMARRVIVAVAAAVVIVLAALPLWLLRIGGGEEPEPANPSTSFATSTSPTSTAATTTSVIDQPVNRIVGYEFSRGSSSNPAAVGETVVVDVVDGVIVEFERGLEFTEDGYIDTNGEPRSFLSASEDGVSWNRRPLPPESDGQRIQYAVIADRIYVQAFRDPSTTPTGRWMTSDLGATWVVWTTVEPDIGMEGLALVGPPTWRSDHDARVADHAFVYDGEPFEMWTPVLPTQEALVRQYGPVAYARQAANDFAYAYSIDGTALGVFGYDTSVVDGDLRIEFTDDGGDGEVFHVGTVPIPAGVDSDRLARQPWLGLHGAWWTDDEVTFEWRWTAALPPFEAPHLYYVDGDDYALAAGGTKIWRIEADSSWTQLSDVGLTIRSIDRRGDVVVLLASPGDLASAVHLSIDGGRTFERVANADDGLPERSGLARGIRIVDDNIVVTYQSKKAWIGDIDGSNWRPIDLPASVVKKIWVTADGMIYYQGSGLRWNIGIPVYE